MTNKSDPNGRLKLYCREAMHRNGFECRTCVHMWLTRCSFRCCATIDTMLKLLNTSQHSSCCHCSKYTYLLLVVPWKQICAVVWPLSVDTRPVRASRNDFRTWTYTCQCSLQMFPGYYTIRWGHTCFSFNPTANTADDHVTTMHSSGRRHVAQMNWTYGLVCCVCSKSRRCGCACNDVSNCCATVQCFEHTLEWSNMSNNSWY